MIKRNTILEGDALTVLRTLESETVDCIITSPPYYRLRDYKVEGQLGVEKSIHKYLAKLLAIFDECKRVLTNTGTCWVVFGDSYDKNKSLCLVPQRFAIKMSDHGWIVRNIPIWWKPNALPASAKDRFTIDYEFIHFFTKSPKYYFKTQYEPLSPVTIKEVQEFYHGKATKDYEGNQVQNPSEVKRSIIKKFAPIGGVKHVGNSNATYSGNAYNPNIDIGRIKRCIWDGDDIDKIWKITTKPFPDAHFAVFPEELVLQCLNAGCPAGGLVLDPFMGSGTVGVVALKNNIDFLGIELNHEYVEMATKRIKPYLDQRKITEFIK